MDPVKDSINGLQEQGAEIRGAGAEALRNVAGDINPRIHGLRIDLSGPNNSRIIVIGKDGDIR